MIDGLALGALAVLCVLFARWHFTVRGPLGQHGFDPLFLGGFLFYLAFAQATAHHQSPLDLRPPVLVGFFLAGLVVHGGLQAWWIEPVLQSLSDTPLFVGAMALTAFNDNALITYLATLLPHLADGLKVAVVQGAKAKTLKV